MGITNAKLVVKKSYEAEDSAEVNFLVDSGAAYSVVPGDLLESLGIMPNRSQQFSLADGTIIERAMGDCFYIFQDNFAAAPVIFGEADDMPILGALTLEALGLVLNPFTRTLHPMRLLMVSINPASADDD